MPIPTAKSKPAADLSQKSVMFVGPPGCGKSSIASMFPNSIFLATEPGLDNIPCMRWEDEHGRYVIDDWDVLLKATKEVVESGKFHTIILDTVDMAYEWCREAVCTKYKEEWQNDGSLGWGKGSGIIASHLRRYLMRLQALNVGVVLLSHVTRETIGKGETAYERCVASLPEKIRIPVMATIEICMFFDLATVSQADGTPEAVRCLRTKPSKFWEAKDRTKPGLPPTIIIPSNDRTYGYQPLLDAWSAMHPAGAATANAAGQKPATIATK